ncbi:MAG: zinc ABC transporter substrate-binding protein [bacterium]|nr:zinc ABC transporter substrate-binding protein [bacterium]
MTRRVHSIAAAAFAVAVPALSATGEVQVVTTLPAYASIAQFVGGERVSAQAISRGDEDAHFVKPKPSFALMLKRADLFVTTGLDLELWAPTLVDKSGNRKIRDGEPGFVSASEGVVMRDVPESVSREGGDVHIYGNPHIHTSPINAKTIAANIAMGLKRVDPAGASDYDANLARFSERIDTALYGGELVDLLGAGTLEALAREDRLIDFLESKDYEGERLIEKLGGWLSQALSFRGRKIVAYHKNWIYLTDLLGLEVVGFVERKPGIPPSARHVHELLGRIEAENVEVLLGANYFNRNQIQTIADRAGCTAVIVALSPMEVSAEGYFELIGGWIGDLADAFDS